MTNKIKILCNYLKYKNKKFKSRLDVEGGHKEWHDWSTEQQQLKELRA